MCAERRARPPLRIRSISSKHLAEAISRALEIRFHAGYSRRDGFAEKLVVVDSRYGDVAGNAETSRDRRVVCFGRTRVVSPEYAAWLGHGFNLGL
jgi:hypothetical protein